ncbi:MFS transporter [Truepera radiovictrix]|uniref:Major facilitator superfamily MFS_1 n=1 Tax=Truepera radiovictrix (strain DSM 17093 / CIP 108686 / LMG 22925 / RQ-24) TaxID=649638 RepID=D7CVT9_TRURR|nr:MFS transporter [Truepera radiovictrix]ADI16000.1 major facilitator superfamily MFS_1 [Truepera radiovictrix DSM 17093]WMT58374.1 MFS transporter [Truepera radiovictrix]
MATPSTLSSRLALSGAPLSLLLIVVHATNDAFTSMLAALLPTLQRRFGLTETALALMVATLSFSSSVTQPFFGAVADRLGRRLVGALGVVVSSTLLSLMGVVPDAWLLFALLLVGGLGSAAFHPAGTSMARTAGGANKALTVSLFSAGGTVGLALGPAIILFVARTFGLEWSPVLMLPGVALGAALLVLAPPQPRLRGAAKPKLFDAALFRGPVGVLCVSGVLRSVAYVTFTNAVPLWLVTTQGVASDSALIASTLLTFSVAAGAGGVIAGALGRHLSSQALITGTMLLALPVFWGMLWAPAGSPLFFALVALAGALVNAGLPLMVVRAQDLAPHAVGTASGMLMGFTWGTAGVLYILIGYLQERVGLTAAMQLSYLSLLPGAALAFWVLRRHRQQLGA